MFFAFRVGYLIDCDDFGVALYWGLAPRRSWFFVAPWWMRLAAIKQRLWVRSLRRKQARYEAKQQKE